MLVSEAITLLVAGELKQLGIKTEEATVLGFINLGILEIYKRFLLWEAKATVTQVADVDIYNLVDGADNVIIDLSDHELLVIERIYDSEDLRYIVNNEKSEYTIYTPRFNQILVNDIEVDEVLEVFYRAAPIFLTATTQTIPLPQQFLEALFLYVGYKGQMSVKAGIKDENNTHFMRFEASCNRIKMEGLEVQPDLESTKFEQRGFV